MEKGELVWDSSFGEDWDFRYYVFPCSETDGHDGYAEVYRRGEFCCKLVLAKSHDSRADLVANLHDKCISWVEDWRARNSN